MSNYLKGFNTGILLHEGEFMALVVKFKTSNSQTHHVYLQGGPLRDLLMLLQNRFVSLQIRAENKQQEIAALIEQANQALVENIPLLEQQDVEQPDSGLLVSSMSVSFDEHDFKLVLILKNETIHHIKVSDVQLQFMIVGVARALENAKNSELLPLLTAGNNYAPVYDAAFNQNGTIDYSLIENEQWKLDLFNQYFLIVYGIENKDGLEYKVGAVIKTHSAINEREIDSIARDMASKSKRLMPYSSQLALIKSATLNVNKDGLPSPQEALQPLAEFYNALRKQ